MAMNRYRRALKDRKARCANKGHVPSWPLWQDRDDTRCRRCGAPPRRRRGRLVDGWQRTLERGPR